MLINDIKLLETFLKDDLIEYSELTHFNYGDYIYPFTNENLKSTYENNLEGKKVLNVTSSGDHVLHSLLNGATDICSFDINRFCKYYSDLKIAMIKKYPKEEFYTKMIKLTAIEEHNYDGSMEELLKNIICDVSLYLTPETRKFWTYYIKYSRRIKFNAELFIDDYDSEYLIAYLENENYYILKEILLKENYKINYIDSDICDIKNNVRDSFDYIHLSNILGRIVGNKSAKANKILISLKDILNKDGIIYDYDFKGNVKYKSEYFLKCFYDVKHLALDNCHSLHVLRKK